MPHHSAPSRDFETQIFATLTQAERPQRKLGRGIEAAAVPEGGWGAEIRRQGNLNSKLTKNASYQKGCLAVAGVSLRPTQKLLSFAISPKQSHGVEGHYPHLFVISAVGIEAVTRRGLKRVRLVQTANRKSCWVRAA